MKQSFLVFLDFLKDFYDRHSIKVCWTTSGFMCMLTVITIYNKNYSSPTEPPFVKWGIIFVLVLSFLSSLLIICDLIRLSLKRVPTQTQRIRCLREQNPLINDAIQARTLQIQASGGIRSEAELIDHTEEILAVVHGEERYAAFLRILGIFIRASLLIFSFTLLAINMTCALRTTLFDQLDQNSSFVSYLFNTISGMFLHGFEFTPSNDIARIFGMLQVFSGIAVLIVVIDLVTSDLYEDISSYRDVIRDYLIVFSASLRPNT